MTFTYVPTHGHSVIYWKEWLRWFCPPSTVYPVVCKPDQIKSNSNWAANWKHLLILSVDQCRRITWKTVSNDVVINLIPDNLLPFVGYMGPHGGQPFEGVENLGWLSVLRRIDPSLPLNIYTRPPFCLFNVHSYRMYDTGCRSIQIFCGPYDIQNMQLYLHGMNAGCRWLFVISATFS